MRNVLKKMVATFLVALMIFAVPFTVQAEEYSYGYARTETWLGSYFSTDGTYDYQLNISKYWDDPNWSIALYKYLSNDNYAPAAGSWSGTIWIEPQYGMTDENQAGEYSMVGHYSGNDEMPVDAFFSVCIVPDTAALYMNVIGPDGSAFPVGDASQMKKISGSYTLQFRGDIPSWYWTWSDTYQSAFVDYNLWLNTPNGTMPNGATSDPWAVLYGNSYNLPAAG